MKCEICGKEAPFFIETYSLKDNHKVHLYFCRTHLITVNMAIHRTIEEVKG